MAGTLTLGAWGCGSNNKYEGASDMAMAESAYNGSMDSYGLEGGSDEKAVADENKDGSYALNPGSKLIKNYNYSILTEEYDKALNKIERKTEEYDGYVENMTENDFDGRVINLTLRIPQQNVENFLDNVDKVGCVQSKSSSVEDITGEYMDVEAHIEALKTQHDRLIELLSKASKLSDIVALEDKLSDVEYELGNYESTKKYYDNMVDYSTVYIDITEAKNYDSYEDDSVKEKIVKGLRKNMNDLGNMAVTLLITLVTALPYIAVMAIIIVIGTLVYKKIRRKSNIKRNNIIKNKDKKEEHEEK